jgi:hypothetical protein
MVVGRAVLEVLVCATKHTVLCCAESACWHLSEQYCMLSQPGQVILARLGQTPQGAGVTAVADIES